MRNRLNIAAAGLLLASGCTGPRLDAPPLESLAPRRTALVRLYAAPIPGLTGVAVHGWFVVRRANAERFDRWEVWQCAGGPFGHVRKNLQAPTADVGAGGTYLVAELLGDAADRVAQFIEEQSPTYPYRDRYRYVPGPNSNTYVQWVLARTGWSVSLPPAAIGKGYKLPPASQPAR